MLIDVEIRGITPLLIHRFNEDAEQANGRRKIKMVRDDPRTQATKAAYIDAIGNFYFSGASITGCMGNAGSNHKATGTRKSLRFVVPSAVMMTADTVTILNGDGPAKSFEVDSRPVTIPATKGRIMRHRPRFDDWGAKFQLEVDDDVLPLAVVHQLLNEGGQSVGIGDFRPEKRGPFGRFRVTRFEASAS